MAEPIGSSYRAIEQRTKRMQPAPQLGEGASVFVPDQRALIRELQERGAIGKRALLRFELWLISVLRFSPKTAKRKRSLVWGCLCDYPEAPWRKVYEGYTCARSLGAAAASYQADLRRALRDYAEWMIEDPSLDAKDKEYGYEILAGLNYDRADSMLRLMMRTVKADRDRVRQHLFGSATPEPTGPANAPPTGQPECPLLPAHDGERLPSQPQRSLPERKDEQTRAVTSESLAGKEWLDYAEAAFYVGRSVGHLRNLVSADAIPHYGKPRSRRFRRDVLDLWLTDRDAAMRKFRLERQAHHGD